MPRKTLLVAISALMFFVFTADAIPTFEGTEDELDRLAIDIVVDGGQPARADK